MNNDEAAAADLHAEATAILTTAAKRHSCNGQQTDFADFLAHVLASTAANVGGLERLLAGRPGSWEARIVEDLLIGTVGENPDTLLSYRTQPLVVPLNVAELVEDHPEHTQLMGLAEAHDEIDRRYWSTATDSDTAEDLDPDQYGPDLDAIESRYRRAYQHYATLFTAAIDDEAARLGAAQRITVLADADPWSPWQDEAKTVHNPDTWDEPDPEVLRLWDLAHDVTPLPNVDIRRPGPGLP